MKENLLPACLAASLVISSAGAQTQVDLRTQGKNIDFSGAKATKPFRMGTQLPAACSVGEAFFKSDAAAGQNWYGCTSTNTWTLQSGASGVPPAAGQADKVLSNDGGAPGWRALGGDISGAPQAVSVVRIQGQKVGTAAPTDGQVLRWNAAAGEWQPYPVASAGTANFSQAFSNATTVTIAGAAHGLGTPNLLVECYDAGTPAHRVEPDAIAIDAGSYDVTVTFATAQTGRCVVNGSGGGFAAVVNANNTFAAGTVQTFQGGLVASSADRTAPVKTGTALPPACAPGDMFFKTDAAAGQNLYFCTGANTWTQMTGVAEGGGVSSVFGRGGTVTAQAGDYSFAQIAGTLDEAQLPSGINASKIGSGIVSNNAFNYVANVTSDIQAQLNGKAAAGHSHVAAGDVAGDITSLTVTKIQSRPVSSLPPADGQALVWSAAANAWQPGTMAGSSEGGAGMASQLGDFKVERTTPTVLTIGANCSAATPCNVRFGNTVYSFTRSCTATISAGSGTAYIYVSGNGTLTIGHNLTVAASAGCMGQPSVSAFPADSAPLFSWTATYGTWDSGGARDLRAFLSNKSVTAGTGIMTVDTGGRTTIAVDSATVPTFLTAASTISFPTINAGQCSADQGFTLAGAAAGDAVAPGWPAGLEPGLVGTMRVSAANTIAVRLCNFSGVPLRPAAATFRATVVRGF
jgi:hypothetical protein